MPTGSSVVDSRNPPVTFVHLVAIVFVGDTGLDKKPIRHRRVILSYDLVG